MGPKRRGPKHSLPPLSALILARGQAENAEVRAGLEHESKRPRMGTPSPQLSIAPASSAGAPSTRGPPVSSTDTSLNVARPRVDLPEVKQRRRGHIDYATLDLCAASRSSMLEDYERDKFAASNQSTRAANLAVWVRLVKLWFGPGTEIIPVEPEHIQAVGAIMKRHGYRPFSQHITRA